MQTKIIYLSTAQVYGDAKNINENTCTNIKNAYALSHLLCENILTYYRQKHNIESKIFRLSNSYGPPINNSKQCWLTLINDICKNCYNKNIININSDGSAVRNFIYINDAINQILKLSILKNKKKFIFNIYGPKTYSVLQVAKIVKKQFEKKFLKKAIIKIKIKKSSKIKKKIFSIKSLNYKINKNKMTTIEKGISNIFSYLSKS